MSDDRELKDQRIPIMMTESEVTAIDDWSFKNRIRSRGEAIRRLCQIGLDADKNLDLLHKTMQAAGDWLQVLYRYLPNEPTHDEAPGVAAIEKQVHLIANMLTLTALQIVRDQQHHTDALKDHPDLKEALDRATTYSPASNETWAGLQEFYRDYSERFPGIGMHPGKDWGSDTDTNS